jgi:hypothetical protein
MAAVGIYPVHVDASLDAPLSRWLWLVKWILLIPHYVVLAFLWVAFVLLSVVAFAAILITGRYPRPIFDFNVGVLRWTWRVQYYSIGAFGTDRYPPFTLAEDPSYPAHLEIAYPRRLSRGLALVKWWLLAIPQYLVIGLFTSGGIWLASRPDSAGYQYSPVGWGLIGLLAVIAAVILLVTGRYPQQIFDFVIGMNRWVLRVAAYAGLMTDQYPPFRLDMGGNEPGGTLTLAQAPPTGAAAPGRSTPGQAAPQAKPWDGAPASGPSGGTPPSEPRPTGWTAGRIISVVAGAVLVLVSLGLLGGGGAALWAQATQRHGGYVDLGTTTYRTAGYAVASETVSLHAGTRGWDAASALFGTVRLRVTAPGGTGPVFIGIAPAGAAARYLAGVSYATVTGATGTGPVYIGHSGGPPAVPPGRAGIWSAHAAGTGTQALTWPVKSGDWTVVAMNANGSRPVSVRVAAAATVPALPWAAAGLLIGGVLFLAGGAALIAIPLRRAS